MTDSRRSLAQHDPTPKPTAEERNKQIVQASMDYIDEKVAAAIRKAFEEAAEKQKQLRNACQQAADLYDALALGPLDAAAKYGPDWEPPTDEQMLEVRSVLAAALKAEEQADE